jgi:hypothetical protein
MSKHFIWTFGTYVLTYLTSHRRRKQSWQLKLVQLQFISFSLVMFRVLTVGSNYFRRVVFNFICQLNTGWPEGAPNLLCAFQQTKQTARTIFTQCHTLSNLIQWVRSHQRREEILQDKLMQRLLRQICVVYLAQVCRMHKKYDGTYESFLCCSIVCWTTLC